MNRIEGSCKGAEIDVKRFYVPGVTIHTECPKCGSQKQLDLGDDYLSHPVAGSPERVGFYCESETEGPEKYCNTEWDVKVILDITVRLA